MSEENATKHRVYLAVPGVQFCWGTTVGVINSTRDHIALPFSGGMGFSGVEDFNVLWTDAHNMYEAGGVTHFAMLHGDIVTDPNQRWLDILLEEMDTRGAALVSTLSPIKDPRGLMSSGIADLNDPWRPWRRFTSYEIHNLLPETFDNVLAGYPDRPLLHNTACWVCDLRNPVFHQANAAGELDLTFKFPDRAIRGPDGKWMHQRESEDWLFSRELWERGIKNTWITRRVHITHRGINEWGNYRPWGLYKDGDRDTADKWRPAEEAKPLALVQIIEFELGAGCNMAAEHAACPNRSPERFADLDATRDLDDDSIVSAAVAAYRELGFTGMIGWIYYNEPLLEAERMFNLMQRIKAGAPQARFILWTNGTLIPEECEAYKQFAQIVISGYNDASRRGMDRLTAAGIDAKFLHPLTLDTRLTPLAPADDAAPCLRPFVEMVFDCHGNHHLCCYDWRGRASLGNLLDLGIATIAEKWRAMLPAIAGHKMNGEAPQACHDCGYRWEKYQLHDDCIVDRARRFRASLAPKDAAPEPEEAAV